MAALAASSLATGLAWLRSLSNCMPPRRRPGQIAVAIASRSSRCCRSPSAGGSRHDVLALDRVTYRYPGAPAAGADDVSLTIDEGEFVVLAGLSASGKSTLLRAACGLVPALPRRRVRRPRQRRPASTRASTVRATLAARRRHAVPGPRDADRDEHGSRRAGASRWRTAGWTGARSRAESRRRRSRWGSRACSTARRTELSGGELQRVALGAALAGRPALVLLDEPTSQLDPVAGDELIWLLRRLNEEWGTAVVLAEHRLERCLRAADRVIALADGRVRLRRDAARSSSPGPRRCARAADAGRAPVRGRRDRRRRRGRQGRARRAARHAGCMPAAPERTDAGGASAVARAASAATRRSRSTRSGTSARAARGPARRRPRRRAGRARRAHGPQRRGQVDAAAPRRRADRPTRGRVARPAASRCCCRTPSDYLLHERVADEASAEALRRVGLEHARRPPPARSVRRPAPAARAGDRARRRRGPP